tara:strand:- start:48892 stop:49623 length:732 start_codon:yes stop_codon:yes gene_type:complete
LQCNEAQGKSSAYLDGELSDEQSSAVRGHLRQCQACEVLFEQESAFIDFAANLEPLEPPDRVWEQISKRIAEEEIADSKEPSWRRWLAERRLAMGVVGVSVCAAAAAILVVKTSNSASEQAQLATSSHDAGAVRTAKAEVTVAGERTQAVSEADANYQQTIAELREMLEEDRTTWTEREAAAVDAALASFRRVAIEQRFELADGAVLVASRDPIYANYRAEISFLQSALAGEVPGEVGEKAAR